MATETIGNTRVLHLTPQGAQLSSSQDALDVIGDAWAVEAQLVAIPVERFAPSFFDLSTGQAGDFVQKLVNYRLPLAVVGDISEHVSRSGALRDFVRESNGGHHLWFLPDVAALTERLAPPR